MSNDWKEEELDDAKTGAEESTEQPEESSTPESEPVEEHKGHIWPKLFLLILLLVAAAGAFLLYAPDTMKERYLTQIKQWLPDGQREIAKPAVPAPKPEQKTEAAPKPFAPTPAPAPETKPAVIERIVPASSAEIGRLLGAINNLQGELSTLQRQQQELKQQQTAVQTMQLRTRLNWITNSANHLPQLQLAWEEISLMPLLSGDERKLAESMLALAQKDLNMLKSWQYLLRTTAESLTRKEHDNIIPAFDNSLLNWLAEQFSIRPSLSREEADDEALRKALLDTSRDIEMEDWPNGRDWLEFRAKLQLRLIANSKEDNNAVPTLDLPESFDAIRADIETLRDTAAKWLERL